MNPLNCMRLHNPSSGNPRQHWTIESDGKIRGLSRHFADDEKQQLFQDAKNIADLLVAVMDRKTQELKDGKPKRPSHMRSAQRPKKIKKGLEKLGHEKRIQAEWQWLAEGQQVRPGLKQLRPEDLPSGVRASRGYDHRGHCFLFEHNTLGELGEDSVNQHS
jgi:hypothetical protein